MIRSIAILISFIVLLYSTSGNAQVNRYGGETGTLNQDYFHPHKDAHTKWLFKDIEKHHLRPALIHIRSKRFDVAIRDTVYLLERIVNHPEGLVLIAVLARVTNDPLLAVSHYEKAVRLYPQYALTHVQYGSYLVNIGRIDTGIERLKKAVEIDPKFGLAYAWLARAYVGGGQTELARQAAAQAQELGYKGQVLSQLHE